MCILSTFSELNGWFVPLISTLAGSPLVDATREFITDDTFPLTGTVLMAPSPGFEGLRDIYIFGRGVVEDAVTYRLCHSSASSLGTTMPHHLSVNTGRWQNKIYLYFWKRWLRVSKCPRLSHENNSAWLCRNGTSYIWLFISGRCQSFHHNN